MKILDLGCGKKKRLNSIGVDFSNRHDADVIHNLNVFPYPFESCSIDEVYMDNVLEHLDDSMRVMEEIYRITKMKGKVKVVVPYFRSVWAFIDPTHKTFYTVNSFAYYDPRHIICKRYDYTNARFLVNKIVFNESIRSNWVKNFFTNLANRYPYHYENFFSHLYPLDDITYYLEKS
jgi:predicted SAM-dependent methyltransferase